MEDEEQEDSLQTTSLKFCPICGGTMHEDDYLGAKWWFCDDPDCGFLEPVK